MSNTGPSPEPTIRTEIVWHDPAVVMPDDETTVLMAFVNRSVAKDGVTCGFRDAGIWCYGDGSKFPPHLEVTHWANWPDAPEVGK